MSNKTNDPLRLAPKGDGKVLTRAIATLLPIHSHNYTHIHTEALGVPVSVSV